MNFRPAEASIGAVLQIGWAMPDRQQAKQSGPSNGPRLQGDMLSATLLALLKQYDAYGYELTAKMSEAGLPAFDSSALYRHLRQLEATGLVSSMWDTSESGPARRIYSLTAAGELFLAAWGDTMKAFQQVMDAALGGTTTQREDGTDGGTERKTD